MTDLSKNSKYYINFLWKVLYNLKLKQNYSLAGKFRLKNRVFHYILNVYFGIYAQSTVKGVIYEADLVGTAWPCS